MNWQQRTELKEIVNMKDELEDKVYKSLKDKVENMKCSLWV